MVMFPLPDVIVMFEPGNSEPLNIFVPSKVLNTEPLTTPVPSKFLNTLPLTILLPSVICDEPLTTPLGSCDVIEPLNTPVPSKVLKTEPLTTPVPSKVLSTEPLTNPIGIFCRFKFQSAPAPPADIPSIRTKICKSRTTYDSTR